MKWFSGSIPEAIQLAKTKRAVFIVYIEGDDDMSREMTATWSSDDITDISSSPHCVALRLEAKSDACHQFSAIYPVVCVPSTFFIGASGTPLEIIGGPIDAAALRDKWAGILQAHEAQLSPMSPPPRSPAQTPTAAAPDTPTAAQPAAAAAPEVQPAPEVAPVTEAAPATETTESPAESPGESPAAAGGREEVSGASAAAEPTQEKAESPSEAGAAPTVSREEKLERAKQKQAEIRARKAAEEKEKLKEKEQERRDLGKGLSKLRQFQKEKDEKEAVSEWKKEKEEARRHREQVKREIERDRLDRAARFKKEKADREASDTAAREAKSRASEEEIAQQEALKRETARLQFRLPDGSAITEQFASSETLGTARTFLRAKAGDALGAFTLATLYPKREFAEADMTSTLLDLQLAPSAVIMVVPSSTMSLSASGGGGGAGLIWLLLAPFLSLWRLLCSFLFSSPPSQSSSQSSSSSSQQQSARGSQRRAAAEEEGEGQGQQRKRPKSSYGVRSRQQGNMHRLTADDDSDDMTTWNGNSTQQL